MDLICCRCNVLKPLDEFVKSSRNKLGVTRRCKACHQEASKLSVQNNPESRKKACSKYYCTHKVEHGLRVAKWKKNNPEKFKEIKARFVRNNPDKIVVYRKQHGTEQLRRLKAKYPQRFKARNKVNRAVAKGIIPKASSQTCAHCGNPAKDYHHHNGYEESNWLDVVPLCKACHKS